MDLLRDIRHAIRSLARAPGFALTTILTLALGIGANTAIFSVVQAVILRPLPYPDPQELVYISSQFPAMGFDQFWVSPPEYFELQERSRAFEQIGAYTTNEANLTAPDRPRRLSAAGVTAELLETLAVPPALGRWFTAEETRPNGPPVAMLSHGLWQSAFGADPAVLGSPVEINGVRSTIVGIMPAGFDVGDARVEVWLPLALDPANRQNRGNHYLYLIGRLEDDVTLQAASEELETLLAAWPSTVSRAAGSTGGPHTPNTEGHRLRLDDLQQQTIGAAATAVLVLQAAVALVLLIACANVASLLLARAESRQKELAVRAALGAGRGHLLRIFTIEGLILSIGGAAIGVGVAVLGLRALLVAYPDSLPRSGEVTLDITVLAFTLLVALATAVAFGVAPLLHVTSAATSAALKEAGQRSTASAARHRLRRSLVAGQVALAVALVVGAGLLLRTVMNLSRVDSGFSRAGLMTFAVSLPPASYQQPAQVLSFYHRLLEDLRALPGITGAAAMSGLPPLRRVNANDTFIEGYTAPPEGPFHNVDYYQTVTAGYIETMGIPIVEGRAFLPSDAQGSTTVLINETMARTFYEGQSPIGRRVRPSGGADPPWFTIIGVVKDVKQGGVDQRTGTELYFNLEQLANERPAATPRTMNIVLRSALGADATALPIQRAVAALDPSIPVIRLQAMDQVFDGAIGRPRLLASLLAIFAGLAVVMAMMGSYAILAYMVTVRRREIGIRMVLGAEKGEVLGLVVGQGMRMAFVGLVLGLGVALAGTRVMTGLLFGVQPADPLTLTAVVGLVTTVTAIGCYLPARSATQVDPMVVLKEE